MISISYTILDLPPLKGWAHGLIKKIGYTYKYYLTSLGRKVILLVYKAKTATL